MFRWNNTIGKVSAFLLLFVLQLSYGTVLLTNISKNSLTVGDLLQFQVSALVPKGTIITPPSVDKGLGNIIVKEWNTQKSEREKSDSISFSYVLTTYIPEQCTIPSLSFVLQNGQKTDTLKTQSIPLSVQSVITADSADLMELKPQQIAGHAPLWWVWALISLLIFAAIYILYNRFFRKKKIISSEIPLLPPYEEAIAALNDLERKKYLQRGLSREYVFELSEILKRYIERRFSVNASEFTTEEMLAWLGISDLEKDLKRSVEWFFSASDPIKFARQIPGEETLDRFIKETRNFLEKTRPVLQETKSAPQSIQTQGASIPEPVSTTTNGR